MAPLYFLRVLLPRNRLAFRNPGPVRKIVIGTRGFYLKRFEQFQQLFPIVIFPRPEMKRQWLA
jgi:hypothetical protein